LALSLNSKSSQQQNYRSQLKHLSFSARTQIRKALKANPAIWRKRSCPLLLWMPLKMLWNTSQGRIRAAMESMSAIERKRDLNARNWRMPRKM